MPRKARALVAPVPHMHLESGLDVCTGKGTVIFGSDQWGLFEERGVEEGAPVYIYASYLHEKGPAMISWQATYVRYIRHEQMHLEERRRRPPTTEGPQEGTWVGFWEVRDLRRLSQEECFPVSDLATEEGKPLSRAFIPHGPVAIRG